MRAKIDKIWPFLVYLFLLDIKRRCIPSTSLFSHFSHSLLVQLGVNLWIKTKMAKCLYLNLGDTLIQNRKPILKFF